MSQQRLVDTNLIVRYLVQDHDKHARAAGKLFDACDRGDVGIVVQAYHGEAESELRMSRDWVNRRGSPITIRLVKGAYWDYEVATARRLGWPEPVYLQKWQSDA